MSEQDKHKGGRGRFQTAADAEEQLVDIEEAQREARKGKLKKAIDNIDKSRQRLRNKLRRIKDLEDAADQYR